MVRRVTVLYSAFGSTEQTAPVVLSAAILTLQRLVSAAQRHIAAAQTPSNISSPHSPHTPTSSSSSSSSSFSFTSANLDALTNSYHLCNIIETLLLIPSSSSPSHLTNCLPAFRRLYSASMETAVFDLCPLLCAYVWRLGCLVAEEEGGGGRKAWLLDAVRRGRRMQWEEEMEQERAVGRAGESDEVQWGM
jgi:hypothetical protein